MGANVNNNFSDHLFETCHAIAWMCCLSLSAIPVIVTPKDDENYSSVLKSSLSGALVGIISITSIAMMRNHRKMNDAEFRRFSANVSRTWAGIADNPTPVNIHQRRNAISNAVKNIGLFTFACSLAFIGNAYYLSYPHLIK